MQRYIAYLYYILAFLTPLLISPKNSEVFELPKISLIYFAAIFVTTLWLIKSIKERKFVFRRTILDIPLLIFILVNIISTYFSIDQLTSIQGYYSRFYGGLTSMLALSILYWGAVTHLTTENVQKILSLLVINGVIISIWAWMEKLGFSPGCLLVNGELSNSCWIQQVQERPFASLGQPNWLAAYLSMIAPLSWHFLVSSSSYKHKFIYLLSAILIVSVILLTKSRSGLIGLVAAYAIYWLLNIKIITKIKKQFILLTASFIVLALVLNPFAIHNVENPDPTVSASSDIRILLWQGALDIWKENPLVGTGPETFAYAYYSHRPYAHNLTSEWNFVYNKAHNEYLNTLANTGFLGLIGIILVIFASMKLMNKKHAHLLAGYVALLISSFFSFTVAATGLLFFLYPGLAVASGKLTTININWHHTKLLITIVMFVSSFMLITLLRFITSDMMYATENYQHVLRSTEISPFQPQYWEKLGEIYTKANSDVLADSAFNNALDLSPTNVKLTKNVAQNYMYLGKIDTKYYEKALSLLESLKTSAPTDPMIPYFIGLININQGNYASAKLNLTEALYLRPNYKEAQDTFDILQSW